MPDNFESILNKYPSGQKENLIDILQEVQEYQGYLSEDSVIAVSRYLQLPASKIFGLATYYNQFRFEPRGKFHIQLCRGTACHLGGSAELLSHLEKDLGIKAGQITRDGKFSLELFACMGACGQSPLICINGEYYTALTVLKLKNIIQQYRERGE